MVTFPTAQDMSRRSHPLALLFTDAKGRVVFVDNNFIRLLAYPAASDLVGLPLHVVMGVDQVTIARLIHEIARTGYLHESLLVMHGLDGATVEVLCSGVAAYNSAGEFIGADMALHDAATATAPGGATPAHGDVVQTRIHQIQFETESRKAREEQVLLQLYFTAQVNMLQVLAARLGGPRIHAALENIVNETAAGQGWNVRMHGGNIILDEDGIPPEGYSALLEEIASYASNLVGRAPVLAEMRAVDERMDAHSREAADQAGLRRRVQEPV